MIEEINTLFSLPDWQFWTSKLTISRSNNKLGWKWASMSLCRYKQVWICIDIISYVNWQVSDVNWHLSDVSWQVSDMIWQVSDVIWYTFVVIWHISDMIWHFLQWLKTGGILTKIEKWHDEKTTIKTAAELDVKDHGQK